MVKKYVNVPVMLQMEMYECGIVCLNMILAYHKKHIPLEQLRNASAVSTHGMSAKDILLLSKKYNLNSKAYRMDMEDLKNIPLPAIIHWNFNHFVVFCGFDGKRFIINDPAKGKLKISEDDFSNSFTGICLTFEKNTAFTTEKKKKKPLNIKNNMLTKPASLLILSGLISTAFALLYPEINRAILDNILYADKSDMIYKACLIILIFSSIHLLISICENIYKAKVTSALSVNSSSRLFLKILSLPFEFFKRRRRGDIASRYNYNENILYSIMKNILSIGISFLMTLLYFIFMWQKSPALSMIALSGLIIYILIIVLISKTSSNYSQLKLKTENRFYAESSGIIMGIDTIKTSGAENAMVERLAGIFSTYNNAKVEYFNLWCKIEILPRLILDITNAIILTLGASLVISGNFTAGILLAFLSYMQMFFAPAVDVVSSIENINEILIQHNQITDILDFKNDKFNTSEPDSYEKLTGAIELKNIKFTYSKTSAPVIPDFNLKINQGESVAVIGRSGCGKSTIAKLICGINTPSSGEILFDGKQITEIPRSIFSSSVAFVEQDITLFAGTVTENLKMWDNTIEDFEVILAARDACIHKDISERPSAYEGNVIENGKNFSGGQRQRIDITRALAQDPAILILDEATSALDAYTEKKIIESIRARGITSVIISHRLSAIRHCDKIVVLDNGKICEVGTHNELISKNGLYTELIETDWRD